MTRALQSSAFVEHVVPVLQERGLVRREYAAGTLRHELFGAGPQLPSRHRATQLRLTSERQAADALLAAGR
jgi:hypothetical protein